MAECSFLSTEDERIKCFNECPFYKWEENEDKCPFNNLENYGIVRLKNYVYDAVECEGLIPIENYYKEQYTE